MKVPTEAKPFASLSSGLLARKGAARPAMRPQGFGQVVGGLEDLGWDDMGFEPPKPAEVARDKDHDAFGEDVVEHPRAHPTGLTPVNSPVHDQQAELAERLTVPDEAAPDEAAEEDIDVTAEIFEFDVEQATIAAAAPALCEVVAPPPVVHPPRPRAERGTNAKAAF